MTSKHILDGERILERERMQVHERSWWALRFIITLSALHLCIVAYQGCCLSLRDALVCTKWQTITCVFLIFVFTMNQGKTVGKIQVLPLFLFFIFVFIFVPSQWFVRGVTAVPRDGLSWNLLKSTMIVFGFTLIAFFMSYLSDVVL